MAWLLENLATIAVSAVLVVVIGLIVWRLIVNKKAGKTSCGCGCENCALKGKCHK